MQEHEYKARDKTVQKMSRDGLREENLRSKKEKRITRREADEKKTAGHREQELDFGKLHKKPTIGDPVREMELLDIRRSHKLLYGTAMLGLILGIILRILVL